MSDLRAKLAALGHRARDTGPHDGRAADLASVLDAEERATPTGPVLVRTVRRPLGAAWGGASLRTAAFGEVLRHYLGADAARLEDPTRTVYLDTETTGLAGGSGTYAFLVGIGRFTKDAFVLRQLFLRGPWEEPALLEMASLLLEGAEAVVTYNGKSFDVPLLRMRYAYHGMTDPFRRSAQVDLLHPARRLWRERLGGCSLGEVERGALGFDRGAGDVPGSEIPQLYFDFLRSGQAAPLRGVMVHNELDICSLAALLHHVDGALEGHFDPAAAPPADLLSLARTLASLARDAEALDALEACASQLASGAGGRVPTRVRREALFLAGRLAKRLERYDDARRHWLAAAESGDVEAMVELAKLSEHQRRDPEDAMRWVEQAENALAAAGEWRFGERLAADLAYRRARLTAKLARGL